MPIILSVSLLAVRMGHGAPPRQLKRKLHCVCNQTRRAILTGPCSIHSSSFKLPPIYLYITIKLLPFCNPYPAKRSPMPYSHIFFSLPLSSSNASIKRFGWKRRTVDATVARLFSKLTRRWVNQFLHWRRRECWSCVYTVNSIRQIRQTLGWVIAGVIRSRRSLAFHAA